MPLILSRCQPLSGYLYTPSELLDRRLGSFPQLELQNKSHFFDLISIRFILYPISLLFSRNSLCDFAWTSQFRRPSPTFPLSTPFPQNGVNQSQQLSTKGGNISPTRPAFINKPFRKSRTRGVNSVIRSRPAATVRSDLWPAVAPSHSPPTSSSPCKPSKPRPPHNPNHLPTTLRRKPPIRLRPLSRRPPTPQRPGATAQPIHPLPKQPTRRAQSGGNRKRPHKHRPTPTTQAQ
jgi:hypothetical protein